MATIQHHSNKHPDGSLYGQTSADLIAFLGGTPRAQYSFSGTAGTISISAQTISACGMSLWGFSSSAQMDAFVSAVKDIRAMLVSFGLCA